MGYKLKKQNVAGKNTGAICALDVKYTNRMFESKDGTTSMKYLIILKGHELLGHPVVFLLRWAIHARSYVMRFSTKI